MFLFAIARAVSSAQLGRIAVAIARAYGVSEPVLPLGNRAKDSLVGFSQERALSRCGLLALELLANVSGEQFGAI